MAGQTVTLDDPFATSDTAASICTKLNDNFQAIQTELARKVTPGDMSMTYDLDMVGHTLTNVGALLTVDAGLSYTTPGTCYYSGGEWFLVTAYGTVQITDSGAISVASAGGINGDYPGSSGASVTYTHSTTTYDFTDSATVYSKLACSGVVLKNSGLTAAATFTFGGSTSGTWSFPNLPSTTAGQFQLMTVDSTGAVKVDNIVHAAVTLAAKATLTGGFTAAADQKHTDSWNYQCSVGNISTSGTVSRSGITNSLVTSAGSWAVLFHVQGLRSGDKITSCVVPISKGSTGTISCVLYKITSPGAQTSVLTGSFAGSGFSSVAVSTGTAAAIAAGEDWYVSISGTATTTDTIYAPKLVVTHP